MFQHYLIGITIQLHRIVCNWCKPLFCSGFYINVSELRENYAKLYRYFSKHYWITRQNSIELLRLFLKTLSDYRTKLYLQFTLQFLKTLSDYTTNLYRSILRYNFSKRYNFGLQQNSMDLIYSKTLSTKLYRSNATILLIQVQFPKTQQLIDFKMQSKRNKFDRFQNATIWNRNRDISDHEILLVDNKAWIQFWRKAPCAAIVAILLIKVQKNNATLTHTAKTT